MTNVAVIKNERVGTKAYILDSLVAPDLAVLDPTLIVGLPPRMTAATGLDALTHAIEAYTGRSANSMSDAQALHAIRLVARWLPRAVSHGADLEARSQMQTAATLAGWAISSSTVGLVHAMSHTIGARHGVPHGIGNGILLPHVIRFNGGIPAVAARHLEVALALGVALDASAAEKAATAAADAVDALLRACNHPTRLSEVGVPKDALGACSEIAVTDLAAAYTARRASPGEIEELYRAASVSPSRYHLLRLHPGTRSRAREASRRRVPRDLRRRRRWDLPISGDESAPVADEASVGRSTSSGASPSKAHRLCSGHGLLA